MPHNIEDEGFKVLIPFLQNNGLSVQRISGTFDLKVDGKYAEMKASRQKFSTLGFVGFSKKQVESKEEFDIYFVCNLSGNSPEIFKMTSKELFEIEPTVVPSYQYPSTLLRRRTKNLLTESSKSSDAVEGSSSSPELH